jgi:alkylation response protein AidB-like acyl-CoA dehydrogenase
MSNVPAPDLHVLSDDVLERLAAREGLAAPGDPTEPIAELGEAGYLLLAVPVELGGLGGNIVQVCDQQRRLGRRAPALALAVNEHLCWTGTAAELRRAGDLSLVWLIEEAAGGELFSGAAGTGDSLVPVAWTHLTLAAVTTGIAERAFELGVAGVRSARPPAGGPDLARRRGAAAIAVELEALVAHTERITDDWSSGVPHGVAWPAKLAAARRRAATGAARIVSGALDLWAGDRSAAATELARLGGRLCAPGLAVEDGFDDIIGWWAVGRAGCLSG